MSLSTMQAINSAHQKTVDQYVIADRHHVGIEEFYDNWINSVDTDKEAMRLENKKERITAKTFEAVYQLWAKLPSREQLNIDKQYTLRFGYPCQMGAN